MKVVVGGPPNSGKSTFTAALIEITEDRVSNREWFDDNEFTWFSLDITDQSLAWLLGEVDERKPDDAEWTDRDAQEKQDAFADLEERLVIADAPGMITRQLGIVIDPAEQLVILANDESEDELKNWGVVASDHEIEVLGKLVTILDEHAFEGYTTEYEGDDPYWDDETGEGLLKDLSRDAFYANGKHSLDAGTKRVVKQMSDHIIELCM